MGRINWHKRTQTYYDRVTGHLCETQGTLSFTPPELIVDSLDAKQRRELRKIIRGLRKELNGFEKRVIGAKKPMKRAASKVKDPDVKYASIRLLKVERDTAPVKVTILSQPE
jgi:hypothetical protein